MSNNYKQKYLKYKEKYLQLKNQSGGELSDEQFSILLIHARQGTIFILIPAIDKDPDIVHRIGGPSLRMLIHEACIGGRLELVKALIARGSPVDPYERGMYSCVYYAASYNHLAVVSLLLDNGADPCSRGLNYTALGRAAEKGYLEICILLLTRGANLTALMRDGQPNSLTALELFGSEPNMSEEQKQEGRLAMTKAWKQGPHPIQRSIRWNRRWPFMSVMAGCLFRPLADRREEMLAQGSKKDEPHNFELQERSRRRSLVFRCDRLLRLIVSFL